ncbi:MAG TPA: O-antigen ligase family protein [Jiangellaceae bacterium]
MTRIRVETFDLLGIGLIVAFAAWTVVSAVARDGKAVPQVFVLVITAVGYVLGRLLGGSYPVPVATVVAVGILVSAIAAGAAGFLGRPLSPPLGYANANGALYAQGVAAAAIVAALASTTMMRRLSGVLALVLFGVTVTSGSLAATLCAAGILLAALVARPVGRRFVPIAPLVVVASVVVTIIVGLTHGAPAVPALEQALTERRAVLWQEAMQIFAAEPVLGIGPGRFAVTSPTALADADARWAHSGPLQVAAETGILGILLTGALLLWTYLALYRSRQNSRLVVIGTAAVTAFAVQATTDYLLHFPALTTTVALLAGLASCRMTVAAESATSRGERS